MRSLSERLVLLVIFAEPFLASLFARDLSGVFLSVSFCLQSSRFLSERLVLLVKSSWSACSLSERLVLLGINRVVLTVFSCSHRYELLGLINRVNCTVSDETSTSFISASSGTRTL